MTIHHESHSCPLVPYNCGDFTCNGCGLPGRGSCYRCQNCCTFVLHVSCATYTFPCHGHALTYEPCVQPGVQITCNACNQSVCGTHYSCRGCNFQVHPTCVQIQIVPRTPQPCGNCPCQSKPAKIGIWGGKLSGYARDVKACPRRLTSVTINSGSCIYAISFTYEGCDGILHREGPWGAGGGKEDKIDLQCPTDFVKEISGTIGKSTGKYWGYDVVTSLTVFTSNGSTKTYGTYDGTPFSIPLFDGGTRIVGFFGRSGQFLDAIGLYVVNP